MKIALIGYGEVGRIFAEDLSKQGMTLNAFDLKLAESQGDVLRSHAARHGVRLATTANEAVAGAALVISAVTASQTRAAARSCSEGIARNTKDADKYNLHKERPLDEQSVCTYLDFNSASPGAKIQAGEIIHQAGGRYVEAAVMTSVPPYRIKVPMLLGGPHAKGFAPRLSELGCMVSIASETLGVASATKMCRSIVIKGMEAMIMESFTAARAYGVEDQVIASLYETFPGIDWEQQGSYFFQRVIEHGKRRSEEMFESAKTVEEKGLTPWSAQGTAERQAWAALLASDGVFGPREQAGFARSPDWRTEADRILASISK